MIKRTNPATDFKDSLQFYEALKQLRSEAILHLSNRLEKSVKSLNGVYLLTNEDIEEVRNDAILITLKKITEGLYQYQNYSPLSYTMAVFKNLLNNRLRKKKQATTELTNVEYVDFSPEEYYIRKEKEVELGEILKSLGDNCEQIIRLKYYDQFKDGEIISNKLSAYSTVDSLKSKRSQCLKKLAKLVRQTGVSFNF